MKPSIFLKVALLAIPFYLSSCASHKNKVEEQTKPVVQQTTQEKDFLYSVNTNKQASKFITSKVKFSVELGSQHVTLTGNLKMKRDDCIQLQLMAFGFVEAARIEFTKEYVLVMDRINKQYMKAIYREVPFLRTSGLNFNSLQALFWNELFMPNHTDITAEDLKNFTTNIGNEEAVIKLKENNMAYSWLLNKKDGLINMANILYRGSDESAELNWDYKEFEMLNNNSTKPFPTSMNISLNTGDKEVKMGIKLSYLNNESDWETRTEISNKYRQVTIEEILQRFMSI